MKKIYLLFLCGTFTGFAQVGINTTAPTNTLDIDGGLRVRGAKSTENNEINAVKIIGVDEKGNFVEVDMAENIVLENNRLRSITRSVEIGETRDVNAARVNDLSIIIVPGTPNEYNAVIRLRNTNGNTEVTGIQAAPNGTTLWLYAVDGEIKLKENDPASQPDNRFQINNDAEVKKFGMVQLMYDGVSRKWILMSNGFH